MEHWTQNYDPFHKPLLSTSLAALPVAVLLSSIALFKIRTHFAALLGLLVALDGISGAKLLPPPSKNLVFWCCATQRRTLL